MAAAVHHHDSSSQSLLVNERSNDEFVIAEDDEDHQSLSSSKRRRQVGGAAVAGGLAGLVLMGPLTGLATAGGAAVLANTHQGKAGNAARATGQATVQVGQSIKRFDEKHHRIVEKTSKSIKEFDQKHRIVEKTTKSWKEFDQKHRVVEKTSKGVVKGCNWLSQKLQSSNDGNRQAQSLRTQP